MDVVVRAMESISCGKRLHVIFVSVCVSNSENQFFRFETSRKLEIYLFHYYYCDMQKIFNRCFVVNKQKNDNTHKWKARKIKMSFNYFWKHFTSKHIV